MNKRKFFAGLEKPLFFCQILFRFLQDFCLEDDGWYLHDSNKKHKLSELDEDADYEKVFYKDRLINENNLEQHLIVTYSIKYRNYQRTIRERQIERAEKFVESPPTLPHALLHLLFIEF